MRRGYLAAAAVLAAAIGLWWQTAAGRPDAAAPAQTESIGHAQAIDASSTRRLIEGGYVFSPSILYDEKRQEFRLWYQKAPGTTGRVDVLHRTSRDAVTWSAPSLVHSGDLWGPVVRPYGDRYRWLFYLIDQASPTERQGVYAAESPDGLVWPEHPSGPLLRLRDGVGDIVDLFYDPIRDRWGAFVKMFAESKEFGADPKQASVRRLTGTTLATDFLRSWTRPTRVFVPDGKDEGETEFYGAACCVVRGEHLVAFLRVLRDDVGEGIGYTVLAWTKDGQTWERSREPLLAQCGGRTYDAAVAWVYGVTEHNGTVYLSYAAYDTGHKSGARAIALATVPSSDVRVPDGRGPSCQR